MNKSIPKSLIILDLLDKLASQNYECLGWQFTPLWRAYIQQKMNLCDLYSNGSVSLAALLIQTQFSCSLPPFSPLYSMLFYS